jgi:predicted SAM-dependent methyltransferase
MFFKKPENYPSSHTLNLNIGCGAYEIPGFLSLDIPSSRYSRIKKDFYYDIRNDSLPFKNSCIKNIYISHVIEHIEVKYVKKFLFEAHRVLKKNGVLRISTPDAAFLYNVSKFSNAYWNSRRREILEGTKYNYDSTKKLSQFDFLIRELVTPKFRFHKAPSNYKQDLVSFKRDSYQNFIKKCELGLYWREDYAGDHISIWDFERLKKLGQSAKFSFILNSKYRGSVSLEMQNKLFDRTHPKMSLYVEMIK